MKYKHLVQSHSKDYNVALCKSDGLHYLTKNGEVIATGKNGSSLWHKAYINLGVKECEQEYNACLELAKKAFPEYSERNVKSIAFKLLVTYTGLTHPYLAWLGYTYASYVSTKNRNSPTFALFCEKYQSEIEKIFQCGK